MMKRLLLLSLLMLLCGPLYGQDVSKQTERKRQIEEEISFIDNQLKSIAGKQKATTEQLALIRRKATSRPPAFVVARKRPHSPTPSLPHSSTPPLRGLCELCVRQTLLCEALRKRFSPSGVTKTIFTFPPCARTQIMV